MQNILCIGLLLFCGGFLTCWGTSDTAVSAGEPGEEEYGLVYEISDCSVFPDDIMDLNHNLTLSSTISCDKDTLLHIPPGQSIFLHAEVDMKFERVHFIVSPGARLTLLAGNSITIERNEKHKGVPVVEVGGVLIAHAGMRPLTLTLVDQFVVPGHVQQDLLEQFEYGAIYTEQEVTFTNHAIIITSADDSSKAGHQQADETEQKDTTQADPTEVGNADTLDAGTTTGRLKVDESLRGDDTLKSSDGTYELWAGQHGSVFFAEHLAEKTAKDGQTSRQMKISTLIPANEARVKGVLTIRAKLKGEAAGEGPTNGGTKTARSWTPWGLRYNRKVQTAREHAGEVELTVDNRGCLEVTVDGSCVLARSGPYTREWVNRCVSWRRRRSADYELHVVADGMQVEQEGRKVWGVSVPKHDDAGERSFFGITAADIA